MLVSTKREWKAKLDLDFFRLTTPPPPPPEVINM